MNELRIQPLLRLLFKSDRHARSYSKASLIPRIDIISVGKHSMAFAQASAGWPRQ
jgi:hypothetical protein